MFKEIIGKIIDNLSRDSALSEFVFINSFAPKPKPNPINKFTVSIGLAGAKISNGAIGDFLGNNPGAEYYGKQAEFNAKLYIYSPNSVGGSGCEEAFSLISNSLLFSNDSLKAVSIECKDIAHDDKTNAYILSCIAKFKIYLGQKSDDTAVSGIVVKGVF